MKGHFRRIHVHCRCQLAGLSRCCPKHVACLSLFNFFIAVCGLLRLKAIVMAGLGEALNQGLFTLSERIDDERELDEGDEHHVEFVKSGEDATEAFKATKQPFDFISALVHFTVVFPWLKTVALGRNNRNKAQVERKLPRLVAFVGFVHEQV